MAEIPDIDLGVMGTVELAGSGSSNAQVALLSAAVTFNGSIDRHNTKALLETADQFKKWLDASSD